MSWIGGECQVGACGRDDGLGVTTDGTYATNGTYGVALVTHRSHVPHKSHPWLVPRACKRAEPGQLISVVPAASRPQNLARGTAPLAQAIGRLGTSG